MRESATSETALRAMGLGKRFGGLTAVRDVALTVEPDRIHAVIGPNGAGKSTLINLLSGELSAQSGTIQLGEIDITRLPPQRRATLGLGRTYQKTTIFPRFTVFENVRLAAQARSRAPLKMFGGVNRDDAVHARAQQAIDQTGLRGRGAIVADRLSHGEQRQLEIAMLLATDPRVILLDEPLAGMGTSEARYMVALIKSLKTGRAVLLVEHDMNAVFALADVLTVMQDGHVIASGLPQDIRRHPQVREAYLGHHGDAA